MQARPSCLPPAVPAQPPVSPAGTATPAGLSVGARSSLGAQSPEGGSCEMLSVRRKTAGGSPRPGAGRSLSAKASVAGGRRLQHNVSAGLFTEQSQPKSLCGKMSKESVEKIAFLSHYNRIFMVWHENGRRGQWKGIENKAW